MKDFTHTKYIILLNSLLDLGYNFYRVKDYFLKKLNEPFILLRHDVDRRPYASLEMAKIEHKLGVVATYYFRVPYTYNIEVIKEIQNLGHEIGYHYESLAVANGNFEKAIEDFESNLSKLREISDVKSIAMHGRPTSKWDSRWLWKEFNYKEYGILSEPYFDIDFTKVAYITDAGRKWGDDSVNLRDKVDSKFNIKIRNSDDIIKFLETNRVNLMLNIHPEHWAKDQFDWYKIYIVRALKNSVKRVLIR